MRKPAYSNFKHFLVETAVSSLKFLNLTKKLLFRSLNFLIGKPLGFAGRLLFYRPFLRLYGAYILYLKKLRELNERVGSWNVFLRKFLTPITIIITAGLIILSQVRVQAFDYSTDSGNQALLTSLIPNEFDGASPESLITETANPNLLPESAAGHYLKNIAVLKPDLNILTTVNPPENTGNQALLTKDGKTLISPLSILTNVSGLIVPAAPAPKANAITVYTVRAGDSLNRIADSFGLNLTTLLWENNLTGNSLIRQGDKLTILPDDGVSYKVVKGDTLQKIANKFKVEADKIVKNNDISGSNLIIGQRLFIPGGRKIISQVASSASSAPKQNYNAVTAIKDLITPSSAKPAAGSKMIWPTVGYRITQYYSWSHTGVDIANKQGTPLYAAKAGVVEKSGWNTGGYGNMILINCGGGMEIRYGHAYKLLVNAGDYVEQGQIIALMGTTGHSTGPHLHFEVIIGGKRTNPLNYVK
jgi:murein DD-endopeptidase MepM/ murein hydrolase activator NlpD